MSDEYTPDTENVRGNYGIGRYESEASGNADTDAEFDRWLSKTKAEAQVEALRDAIPEIEADNGDYGWVLSLERRADRIAREAGIKTGEKADCDPHNLVQHRDMKPPWCNKCGRDASGQMQRKEQDDA